MDASELIHSALQWQGENVADIITELADGAGFVFHTDANRAIHYKLPQNLKPAAVSYGDGGVTVEDVVPTQDITNLATSVLVIGGFGLSENLEHIYPTTGGELLLLGLHWGALPSKDFIDVDVNIGTDQAPIWSERSVGFNGFEYPEGRDVLWDSISSTLTFAEELPTRINGVRVRGAQRFGNIREIADHNAVTRYGRRTVVVTDQGLTSYEMVRLRAQAVLNQHAQASGGVTFKAREYVAVGQLARFISNKFEVDDIYIIDTVAIKAEGNTEVYEVALVPLASNVALQ